MKLLDLRACPKAISLGLAVWLSLFGWAADESAAQAEITQGFSALKRGDRETAITHYRNARRLNAEAAKELGDAIPKRIPRNIEECFAELDWLLSDESKEKMRLNDGTVDYHFGLGLWMRNQWGLWSGGRLAGYFTEMGVFHPDEMSGIILSAYQSRLQGRNFDVKGVANSAHRQGKNSDDQAFQVHKQQIKKDPTDAQSLHMLGIHYASRQQWRKAIKTLEKCIEVDPASESSSCYSDLAHAYFSTEQPEKGLAVTQKAFANIPPDDDELRDIRLIVASYYLQNKQWENAIQVLESTTNKYYREWWYLGNAFYHMGRWDEAIAELQLCVKVAPDNSHALFLLGISQARFGDIASAKETYIFLSMLDEERAAELKKIMDEVFTKAIP